MYRWNVAPSQQFANELENLIHRVRSEYDLTYAEIVGVLELVKFDIMNEAQEDADEP